MEPPGTPIGVRLLLLLYGLSLLGATVLSGDRCSRLNCSIIKRQFCPPGSDDCGPCLPNHVEMHDGSCVDKAKLHPGMPEDPLPDQAVIDYLAILLRNQESQQLQAAIEGATKQIQNEPAANNLHEKFSGKNRAEHLDVTLNPTPATSGAIKGSPVPRRNQMTDSLLLGLVVSCTVVGLTALVVATVCWCRLKKEMKLAQKADYSSNKVMGPPPYEKSSPVDKKLAQSAQMYHYQHQKQQMLSMEKTKDEPKLPDSNPTSDEENEDGDFTVYECPGLAPTGEMEVKNPLFDDSSLHHPNSKLQ